MNQATFTPLQALAPTGAMLRDKNDSYTTSGKYTLFPSMAAGRGSRQFLLAHVLVHVLSVVLSVAFVAQVPRGLPKCESRTALSPSPRS